ncbi:MAG: hypothetical protein RLZZ324_385 [Candidatus Parcubacteria bacterium]|jgi:D-alanyl-D-alanine carboxypeptidase
MFAFLVSLALHLSLATTRTAVSWWDFVPAVKATPLPVAAAVPRPEIPTLPVKKDADRLGVETSARAAVVVDWKTGAALFEKDADEPMSIASVSKLMTALVVLGANPDWKKQITLTAADMRAGAVPYLSPAETVTVQDLLGMSLVASSNEATIALAKSTGMTLDEFTAKMNETAAKIGMTNSHFNEPTGLDEGNKASARDVALLIRTALTSPEVRAMVVRQAYDFTALTGREHHARATDELLGSFLDKAPYRLLGGKTGFINEAGYCFGAAAENADGDRVIAVVLGADSKEQRFSEVKALIYWSFDAYAWPAKAVSMR